MPYERCMCKGVPLYGKECFFRMKKYVLYVLLFDTLLCSCVSVKVQKNRLYFPISIIKGNAELSVFMAPVKNAGEKTAAFERSAQFWKKRDAAACNYGDANAVLFRESPSEYDHLSTIRFSAPTENPKINGSDNARSYEPYNVIKKHLTGGERFAASIPAGYCMWVTVTNPQAEELELACSGRVFRLLQHESKTLEFR